MKVQRLAIATMVALTVGGLASLGSGTALAGTPGAHASGGSSATGAVFQQNTAQEARQNNHCSSSNDANLMLTGARTKGRCLTTDDSVTELSEFRSGGADAVGGSSGTGLFQQNTAQRGRQNNNCSDLNQSGILVQGGRLEDSCADTDTSTAYKAFVRSGGAKANGGSGAASVTQQNIAQEGRQNNNCGNLNAGEPSVIGGSSGSDCVNDNASADKHTWIKGGGAEANGGSGAGTASVFQQDIAQEGRQNNNCGSPNLTSVTGGSCANADASDNEQFFVKGGRAKADGGSATTGILTQQNVAQGGRQNNNCASPNSGGLDTIAGSCENTDGSTNRKVAVKGAGAHADGGSAQASLIQQNVAQQGRQNNNCASPNRTVFDVTGGSTSGTCAHEDGSTNEKVLTRGGGAEATGGSSGAATVDQQNTAQEGRQNNNCANANASRIEVTGGRYDIDCGTTDNSANTNTTEIGGGAKADGGSSTADLFQQNTAQEGRQNNNCGNPNNATVTLTGSRSTTQCTATDESTSVDSDYR
ncbi:hypothetical protein [Streptomyces sp. NPDC047108]|uniref:hypothetical protein n=1 Tax=Streptomyces sp. NPDC047108 TaxID=3155025 RepID=UPI0033D22161